MADLTELQASGSTKIVGSDSTGLETFPLTVESDGGAKVKNRNGIGSDAVNIQDGGNSITVDDGAGSLTIDSTQFPTTLGQKTIANSLAVVLASDQTSIPVTIASSVEVEIKNDIGNPLSISATSLPLPTGASTAANQTTEIASLASIDSKTPALVSGRQPVDGSGVTQPVSATTLPLPSGAATAALQTTGNTSLASIDAGIPNALGAALVAASMPVNIASDQIVPISATALPLPNGASTAALQSSGNSSLTSLDAKTATLGQKTMAGSEPVVLASDQSAIPVTVGNFPATQNVAITSSVEIEVKNDTGNPLAISAVSLPLPTSASTAALQTTGNTSLASIDAGIPNALGQATMSASMSVTIASDQTALPVSIVVSDKLATGTISVVNGVYSVVTQGYSTLMFHITGTWVATILPEATIDGANWFLISATDRQTDLRINSTATNRVLGITCGGFQQVRLRASSFTSGTIAIASDASVGANAPDSSDTIRNNNSAIPPQSQLVSGTDGTNLIPLAVDGVGRLVTSSLTGFGADFAFGDITTASLNRVLVKRTAYTEQTTNAQRSIVSSSTLDTALGTGARTILITYLDATGAGPYTETLTLNGIVAVNTVATNICYIEQVSVITAGATGSNAGIISIKSAVAGAGATIGTIPATDNQTFWAHHYVPTGKTCNVTGISCGHTGTTVGSGALFTINALTIGLANGVETQLSDFVRLYGQTSTFARNYSSPIKVTGPARLQIYVTPESTSSIIYRAAFDFFEP